MSAVAEFMEDRRAPRYGASGLGVGHGVRRDAPAPGAPAAGDGKRDEPHARGGVAGKTRDEERPGEAVAGGAQWTTPSAHGSVVDEREGAGGRPQRGGAPGRAANESWSAEQDGQPRESGSARAEFHSVHVYGGKAALCFSADDTRRGASTVRVEGAPSRGPRSYDWQQKVGFQFTTKELPQLLCVLMGWIPLLELKAHGPAKDKGIKLTNQDGGQVFVQLWQAKNSRAVPATAVDLYGVIDLVVKQMLKSSPHMTADALLMVVKAMASRFKDAGGHA